jgi:Domain of unknown function (DUF4388)
VALQGTLDTFALVDVFRLLASTNKTGRLRVTGNRGNGNVWFDGGGVVLASAHNTKPTDPPVSVIFELLRQREGSFVFEADDTTPEAGAPSDVDTLIREAEHLLIEWQEIEAVVPSIDVWVCLSAELPRPEVVVDEARWKVIVATGAGATVAEVGDRLGLGEIGISKAVKEVVEIGLLTISDAPMTRTATSFVEPAPIEAPVLEEPTVEETWPTLVVEQEPAVSHEPDPEPDPEPESEVVIHLAPEPVDEGSAPAQEPSGDVPVSASAKGALGIDIPGFSTLSASVTIEREPEPVAQPTTPKRNAAWAERVRAEDAAPSEPFAIDDSPDPLLELPNLTPQAARAIAAAAQAHTDAERDAALAMATGPDDEPLDRDLLLRFLSSVKR